MAQFKSYAQNPGFAPRSVVDTAGQVRAQEAKRLDQVQKFFNIYSLALVPSLFLKSLSVASFIIEFGNPSPNSSTFKIIPFTLFFINSLVPPTSVTITGMPTNILSNTGFTTLE